MVLISFELSAPLLKSPVTITGSVPPIPWM